MILPKTMRLPETIQNLKAHARQLVCRSLYGVDPIHLHMSRNLWTFILWNKDEVPYLENNSRLLDDLDKLTRELTDTDRKTTAKPEMVQIISHARALKYQQKNNILTNLGMAEMAKRSTGASASTNTHHAVGTGTAAETLNDAALAAEVYRKVIGTRSVISQTERYGTAVTGADIPNPPNTLAESGIFTAAAAGILIMRVTSDPFQVTNQNIFTVQTNVTHQNGIEA